MKQAIIIRTDLRMSPGKLAAQACHASVGAMLKASLSQRRAWLSEGMKKIVLRVSSERELLELHKAAKARRLPAELVIDRGLTELPPGTRTALGIGPADERRINQIIEKLKLL